VLLSGIYDESQSFSKIVKKHLTKLSDNGKWVLEGGGKGPSLRLF
jgi:hypothetical protein